MGGGGGAFTKAWVMGNAAPLHSIQSSVARILSKAGRYTSTVQVMKCGVCCTTWSIKSGVPQCENGLQVIFFTYSSINNV